MAVSLATSLRPAISSRLTPRMSANRTIVSKCGVASPVSQRLAGRQCRKFQPCPRSNLRLNCSLFLPADESRSHDFKKNLPLQPNHLLPASIKIPLPASYTEHVMSSQRRIDSSRANGAKSRGAVTPVGKYSSSRNNLRHGLLAKSAVLEEERSEAFLELLA